MMRDLVAAERVKRGEMCLCLRSKPGERASWHGVASVVRRRARLGVACFLQQSLCLPFGQDPKMFPLDGRAKLGRGIVPIELILSDEIKIA